MLEKERTHRDTGTERRRPVKTEVETGVMLPQTMEPWGALPAGRGEEAFSPRAFGGSTALSNFDF